MKKVRPDFSFKKLSHGLFSIFCSVPPGSPPNDLICPILMARGEGDVLGEAAVATYHYDQGRISQNLHNYTNVISF